MDSGKPEKLQKLFATPRMGHAPLDETNSVKGLFELIKLYFKPNFQVVEIGSFQGVSTLLFALFAEKVYSVDNYSYLASPDQAAFGSTTFKQMFIDAEKLFTERILGIPNIVKVRKSSIEAAVDFKDNSLDVVYIDGEHDYENIKKDIRAWKNKIKKGGLLAGHDWYLPFIYIVLSEENLLNELMIYPDSSWSVLL